MPFIPELRRAAIAILLLGAVLVVPAVAPAQPQGHDAAANPTTAQEGHNQRYVDPELDVDRCVQRFESESREVFALRESITAALGLREGMAVADIGAGTGAFLDPIEAGIGANGHYFAVEISPRFVEHLRDRAMQEGYSNLTAVLSAPTSATLPAHSIDLAFVCDTYHHFDDPQAMLASIRTALRPGGEMVVVDFDKDPEHSREWIQEHVRATKSEFTAEIEAAGFEFVEELDLEGLEDNFFLRFRRP